MTGVQILRFKPAGPHGDGGWHFDGHNVEPWNDAGLALTRAVEMLRQFHGGIVIQIVKIPSEWQDRPNFALLYQTR